MKKPATNYRPPATANAFSLIELVVAMAITAIIMVTLFSFVGQTTHSYTQSQRAVNAVSGARAFIQFFDREFSTRLPSTPLIHEKKSGETPSASSRIAFVRAISPDEHNDADPGDLATSIYYVEFSGDGADDVSPKLFRKSLGPKETQAIIGSTSPPSFPPSDPTEDEPIIPNVLSFEATPMLRESGSGTLVEWTASSPEPPCSIALTIRFLDESSAQQFKSKAQWDRLATSPRDSERQLIRTFTRNIAVAK